MAKRLKDLGDWTLASTEPAFSEPSTPTRRTRRGASEPAEEGIKLARESDGTTLKKGDCILISGKPKKVETDGDSYHAVIVDICTGIHKYLEILVAPLVRPNEESGEKDAKDENNEKDENEPNSGNEKGEDAREVTPDHEEFHPAELLLTSEVNDVLLRDVVEKVQVLSETQFAELGGKTRENTNDVIGSSIFLCCRATDRYAEKFSTKFDFSAWHDLLMKSSSRAIEFVAEKTSIIVSPVKKRAPPKPIHERAPKTTPQRKRYVMSDSDLSSTDTERDFTSDESDDEDAKPARRGRPPNSAKKGARGRPSAANSPKKRARDNTRAGEAAQQAIDVLSPRKRGFKVKSGSSLAQLPSWSRDQSGKPGSAAQEAFRELKEKLHLSTRVASLPCREEQFAHVYTELESALREKAGCCIYLSGTPGTGKTATVREVVGALHESAAEGYTDAFEYLEINCLQLLSPGAAYEKLYEHISGIKVTPANANLLLEAHFKKAAKDAPGKSLVVLVDELDQLLTKAQTVLYNLFNWPTYEQSRLIVVAVANTMDLPEKALTNKTASRLGLRRYAFRGYTEEELGIIIAHRLTLLSETNKRTVEILPDAMRFASKKVSRVTGDARQALSICRRAVEIAENDYLHEDGARDSELPPEQQKYAVRIPHISRAIAETVNSPMAQAVAGLPFAAKLLLAAVLLQVRRSGRGETLLGDVIDEMRSQLQLLTRQGASHALKPLGQAETYVSLLYGQNPASGQAGVRLPELTQIVAELVEQGILAQSPVASMRHRSVRLTLPQDEAMSALKSDPDIAAML
ncbi:hypothetical protein OXX80_006936 [Metschnikowia pulcherrima]